MNTLFEALNEYVNAERRRVHMPGHKGKPIFGMNPERYDVTELPGLGDLYGDVCPLFEGGDDCIKESERRLAAAYGAESSLFLTGGSTQGIFAALYAAKSAAGLKLRGHGTLLADACSHRSSANAAKLLNLDLDILPRFVRESDGVALPLDPELLEDKLKNGHYTAVSVVSPTYHGILSPVDEIDALCREYGTRLIIDGAHGAHLYFPNAPRAFAVVCSAHKTLPAFGQAAFVLTDYGPAPFREGAAMTGTSSPSYMIMASIDLAREFIVRDGERVRRELFEAAHKLPGTINDLPRDPLRAALRVKDGAAAAATLRRRGIEPEFCDRNTVTLLFSLNDTVREIEFIRDKLPGLDFLT